ncbi:MAG TPA: DJ-1/PfpI family protein [Vicinamibacterales bacterium]|jgi:putative intracellular protease/amidase|nr:DJ-1/PfpI family protein [Vicinamibacterales bacterium]
MKPNAYHLVFNGHADWETPFAMCAITESGRFNVVTVGFSREPVTTMGGMKIMPDITTKDLNIEEAAIFVLPGGTQWEQGANDDLEAILRRVHGAGVPVAAICGATLAVIRAGLTRKRRHTSNGKWYVKGMIPEYRDEAAYVESLAVTDGHLITASGLGGIEFAREVIKLLGLYEETEAQEWFEMHKHGVVPAKYQSAR